MEDMYERADFAREIGSIIVMIDLTVGYTAIQSMAKWARRNGVLLHLHRAGHSTYTRQKSHGVNFRVIAKWMRLAASTTSTRGRWWASSRATRPAAGYYDALRCDKAEPDPLLGLYFEQDWVSMPGVMPVASGGIHAGQMHQLLDHLGEDVILQFGGGTIGHPLGIAAGATANRVALEAMVKARNEGRDLLPRARTSLRRPPGAAGSSTSPCPPGVTSRSPTSPPTPRTWPRGRTWGPDMRITQGTFSYLPDLTDEEITRQLGYALGNDWAAVGRVHRRPAAAEQLLGHVGPADVRPERPRGRAARGQRVPQGLPGPLHQGLRLRLAPGPPDDRAVVPGQPAGPGAGLPA